MKKKDAGFLLQDIAIITLSILVAIVFVKTGVLASVLSFAGVEFVGSFIAGMFFTSVFTMAPAIAALGEIAREHTIVGTAAIGTAGALMGDLIIFRFIRDRFSEHLMELIRHRGPRKRLQHLFQKRSFRWLTFLAGGLVIASPLPDELGISLLGFSKMRMAWFVPFSFFFNFLGICLIGLAARAVSGS